MAACPRLVSAFLVAAAVVVAAALEEELADSCPSNGGAALLPVRRGAALLQATARGRAANAGDDFGLISEATRLAEANELGVRMEELMGSLNATNTTEAAISDKTLVKITGKKHEKRDFWIKRMMSGKLKILRVLRRPEWARTLRCRNESEASCEACSAFSSGADDCWADDEETGRRSLKSRPGDDWARYLFLFHVSCRPDEGQNWLRLEFTVDELRSGSLSFFFDGKELTGQAGGLQGTVSSPMVHNAEDVAFEQQHIRARIFPEKVQAHVNLTQSKGHEFRMEFRPSKDNVESSVSLENVMVYMQDDFARCQDQHACVQEMAKTEDGFKLRNDNALQLQCLEVWDPYNAACRQWRRCLKRNGEHHARNMLALLVAAGAGESNFIATAPKADQCLFPPTEDPQAWDCDCYAEMERRCMSVQAHRLGNAIQVYCLRAIMCWHPRVCDSWKTHMCKDPFVYELFSSLTGEDLVGSIMPKSSDGVNLLSMPEAAAPPALTGRAADSESPDVNTHGGAVSLLSRASSRAMARAQAGASSAGGAALERTLASKSCV
mmetsp:Transcript_92546/g.205697  ORF Transcript_92546/g.205697 Transcript_92546/m.205697 type:complete len:552 (+) Transcript_92546:57-1712(+)